jgi:EmrB/QacA subfamily drug resistance transporter
VIILVQATNSSIREAPADRNRWIALIVLCVGMLMIVLDQTIVNVALPSIKEDLGFSQSSLAWVVNAYLITFGGLLLLAGRLGDLVGRKSVFMAGLALFIVASALCGFAQTQEMLVGARFLQGVGGAVTSAVILGMIVTMFPEPREQAKAIGVYSFVAAAGASLGLLLGGVLTQAINWHWIFFVNIPIGLLTAFAASRLVDHDEGLGFADGTDALGAVLITGALMLGVYTIVEPASDLGWTAGQTLALGAVSLTLLAAFITREATARTPLIPLRIVRSRNVSGANAVEALFVAGMFGMFFLGSLYMEQVLGYSALEIGLAFLPVALAIGVLSLGFSERLNMRFGAKPTLLVGQVLILGGLVLFANAPVHSSYVSDLLPIMLLLGVGAGLSFPSLMTLAMSSATQEDSGLASGLVNTSLQVGGALGLAVLATLSSTRTESLLSSGSSPDVALTDGFQLAFWIGAGLVAAAIAVTAFVVRGGAAQAQPELAEAPNAAESADAAYQEAA